MIVAFSYLPQLLRGLVITIELLLLSLFIGMLLSLLLTFLVETKVFIIKWLAKSFIYIVRGTPLLVQFFIVYYGSGEFSWIRESFLWFILKNPFGCAAVTLAINTSAYTSVIFQGAIASIPQGEKEAVLALGFSKLKMYYHILVPKALRSVLPAYSNEVIMISKGTSLSSTIALMDLMGVTKQLIGITYDTIPLLLISGGLYVFLNGIILIIFNTLIKKYTYCV